jgi:hypothetical protein
MGEAEKLASKARRMDEWLNQTSVDIVVLRAFHGDNKSWYRDYGWGTLTSHKHTN